jgi:hypothetical protein
MSIALALAARKSSSAGRCASVGCTTSVMRSIGQSVRSAALLLQTSAARRSEPCVLAAQRPLAAAPPVPAPTARSGDVGSRPT